MYTNFVYESLIKVLNIDMTYLTLFCRVEQCTFCLLRVGRLFDLVDFKHIRPVIYFQKSTLTQTIYIFLILKTTDLLLLSELYKI